MLLGLHNLYSLTDHAQELALPVKPGHVITKFIGSCNWLLCFCVDENPGQVIVIWNPATRKNVKLPDIFFQNPFIQDGIFSSENTDVIHGFGYDFITDDYRVVLLVQYYKDGYNGSFFETEANVYSLRSNTWRKLLGFPNYRVCMKQLLSVLECGALHWFIMEKRESEFAIDTMVASFDLATEECSLFSHPDFADLGVMSLILSKLENCLSIVCNYFELGTESWTKLLKVGSEIMNPSEHCIPFAYSESGDEVLLMIDFEELYWL